MNLKLAIIILCLFSTVACGSAADGIPSDVVTGLPPIVSRVDPDTGAPGDTINIYGYGFSSAAENNVVILGGSSISATGYALVEPATATEIEIITTTVPSNAAAGVGTIEVVVYTNVSNTDITFTVTP